MNNPLLDFSGAPRFDLVTPEHVQPGITELLSEARALIETLTRPEAPASWEGFVAPLSDMTDRLSRAWGVVRHLHSVLDLPPWREAYNNALPEVTRFFAEVGQNAALFERYKALAARADFASWPRARRKVVEDAVRDFRLSGAELPDADKPRFQAIQEELAGLSAKFSENLLDATNAWHEDFADESGLAGLPPDSVATARAVAEKAGVSGYRLTLQGPCVMAVLRQADNRGLRERIWRANATRASEFSAEIGHPEWDNGPLIARILTLREEAARLLGYPSHASVSLVPKMANSPAEVIDFLLDLARRARPSAERDLAELREFAAASLGISDLQPWDMGYAAEKLRQARYDFSEEALRQYFPEDKVLAGLFGVVSSLYGVSIRADKAPVWHEAVRYFTLSRDGQDIGHFYLDPYARDTKRGGAWMDEARSLRDTATGRETPIAYLVCNASPPAAGRPALYSFDQVITLFHEAGHGLHHLLTRVAEPGVSGINGVEWDAVELPSQFMENFCWEWEVLSGMTAHVDTGAPIPRDLFERMLAAKNFHAGLAMLRQVEFALFDMRLHSDFNPADGNALALLQEVRKEVAVIHPPAWQRFPNAFSHIFAGGYSAGYFSYHWAEVLSADAYSAFEEAAEKTGSVLDRATGERFMQEVLGVGGSRPALESFTAFRGRAPKPDALLRHHGMITA
ncbi:M3 family metallopeptidase [Niveibacterium sp. 24ML]|uniref:M3 family metallopeptidase n=1 Tax=Niveibacterium sp. 24ML TaxID=2985512 RepID=UPI002271BE11|nr:M3 family metallopeptidase [Niveibacterium sp. 24ML]MCX9157888.1 M3 family metallopeptidase [Niveibacterium sp. 24ML]